MNLDDLLNELDFSNFDYFYHETERGIGQEILERGLLIEGTNIINTDNIIFTTVAPLSQDMVSDEGSFQEFLEDEKTHSPLRDVSEMVIIASPKEDDAQIAIPFNDYVDGTYYEAIIPSSNIVGFIDLDTKEIVMNEECQYIEGMSYTEDKHI